MRKSTREKTKNNENYISSQKYVSSVLNNIKNKCIFNTISLWSGATGLERLACSKYYSAGKTLPKIHKIKKAQNLSSPIAPLLWQIGRCTRRLLT